MDAPQAKVVVVAARLVSDTVRCSIIIPVLNEAKHLPAQLMALQTWRSAGHEIIVVDGGSEDGSADIAQPLVDQFVVSSKGRAAQMNKGAALANNTWLLFLHVDTFFSATAMDSLQRIFEQQDTKWGRFNVRLSGNHLLFKLIAGLMNLRSRLTRIATGDQAMFVRKDIFQQVAGFPNIVLMEDISLSRKLRKIAAPCCLTDTVTTSSRRWRKHGVIKTIFMMWSLRLGYFLGVSPVTLAKRYNRAVK